MLSQRLLTIALACTIPLWGWAIAKQATTDTTASSEPVKQQKSTPKATTTVLLNPKIAQNLPNLSTGYLFNSERFIKNTGTSPETTGVSAQAINIETLQYDGSIIIGEIQKALISFAVGKPMTVQKRGSKPTKPRSKAAQSTRNSKIIMEGDTIAGYTVTTIEPLQLTFTRGSETIQKNLFSKEKQRRATPRVKTKRASSPKPKAAKKKKTRPPTPTRVKRPNQPPPPPRVGH